MCRQFSFYSIIRFLIINSLLTLFPSPWRRGGFGRGHGLAGQNGSITGKACPRGLYGIFCEVASQVIFA